MKRVVSTALLSLILFSVASLLPMHIVGCLHHQHIHLGWIEIHRDLIRAAAVVERLHPVAFLVIAGLSTLASCGIVALFRSLTGNCCI